MGYYFYVLYSAKGYYHPLYDTVLPASDRAGYVGDNALLKVHTTTGELSPTSLVYVLAPTSLRPLKKGSA